MMSKTYWENRAAQRELESQLIASKYLAQMGQSLREAQQDILRQIETFYVRYANENKVTLAEARKYLTAKELKDFKNIDLKRFREMSLSSNPEYDRILNAVSYRVRISRLEAMNLMIEMRMAELYGGYNGLQEYTYTGLMEVYQNSYYKTMFDLSMQGLISGKVAALTDETMKEALTYNWSGKEFSERIWRHQKSTFQSICKSLERSFAAGYSIDRTSRVIMEATNAAYSRAEALVRTESNFFHNLAAHNGYTDAGIEKYEILATLDSRTSEICREQDGKIYNEKDFKPGTNAPPFHVRCRTTTIPWFDESEYMDGEKRQSADGLIDSMTYEEWEKKFVKVAEHGKIDIEIDKFTPCLQNRKTGEIVQTEYSKLESKITKSKANEMKKEGWQFDWSLPQKGGYDVYELRLQNDNKAQGLIALKNEQGFTFVPLVESAPRNIGKSGEFEGVGGHLFAIACEQSFISGNDGYVAFEPKTNLIKHYQKTLKAQMLNRNRMFIDTKAAQDLMDKYIKK